MTTQHNQVKCPRCGALGNKLKNVSFLNCCTNCSEEGLFYDNKQQVYRYDIHGKLRKIGRAGVIEEPGKEDLLGLTAKQISTNFGVCIRTARYWMVKHGLFKKEDAGSKEIPKEEKKTMSGGRKEKLPVPEKKVVEGLIIKHGGSIDAMAKAHGVSWHVMNKWINHHGLQKMAKQETKRFHIKKRTEKKIKTDVFKKMFGEGQTKENIAKYFGLKRHEVDFWVDELQLTLPAEEPVADEGGVTPQEPSLPPVDVEDDEDFPPKKCARCGVDIPEGEDIFIDSDTYDVPKSLASVCSKCYEFFKDLEKFNYYEDQNDIEPDTTPPTEPNAIIQFAGTGRLMEFPSLAAALAHIEENCSKRDARGITLYQRVPFSFGVNVIPGEVS